MITTERLTKRYGATLALDGLDLEVKMGEVFGFLGPNGAGKTTTLRILTTLTRPDAGRASVGGLDVVRDASKVKRTIGVVQQHVSLDRELTVAENLEVHARLHRMPGSERQHRMSEVLQYVELADRADQVVNTLSGGMRRRVMIARALLHRPKLLFLDEPTAGLDAQSRRRLWDLIKRMNAEGSTVFLTTHYIEEAEALCDRVGILDDGRLIGLGTPAQLRERLGPVVVDAVVDSNTVHRFFQDREDARSYLGALSAHAGTVTVREANLEDVFVELTGRKVTPNG